MKHRSLDIGLYKLLNTLKHEVSDGYFVKCDQATSFMVVQRVMLSDVSGARIKNRAVQWLHIGPHRVSNVSYR